MRVGAGVLLPLVAMFLPALVRAEEPPPRTVSSSGEAVVYVAPNEVVVNFGIESFETTIDRAKADNDEAAAKLVKAVRALGVESRYIQTDRLQVEIEYQKQHAWEGVAGYYARRSYTVTLKDIKQFEALVDAALKNGANQLEGVQFRTTELRKYRDQARQLAIRAAREKAAALAKELDCGIGSPQSINETGGGYYSNSFNSNSNGQNVASAAPAGEDQEETLPPGQIAVRAGVSVTFDLLPGR